MKKYLLIIVCSCFMLLYTSLDSYPFTQITNLVFDDKPVAPEDFDEVLNTIKENKIANKKIRNPKKKKPDKLFIIKAKQPNPDNIQIEIDTSQVVVESKDDIQAGISNQGFLDAIQEAVDLWEGVPTAKVKFAPLKFASSQANPEDGKNVISFRGVEAPEGTPDGTPVVSIVSIASTPTVLFMNKIIMVEPGTILDTDIIYDPTNNPCLVLNTTTGDFKIGGENAATVEGGIDPTADASNCDQILSAEITDLAVKTIANLLGLESSAISSAASSNVAQSMVRYALTSDDNIGLTNIYPDKLSLINHGNITGKVLLNNKGVRGAHVVLEDTTTGEPVTSTITDLKGKFKIIAIPAGTYTVYAEPLDGPLRKNTFTRNFFGFTSEQNFTTGLVPEKIIIEANKTKKIKIDVKELSASAFNINYLTGVLTEVDIEKSGGSFFLPITIMPGETLSTVQFWGSNISPDFGTLSISGTGLAVSNLQADTDISISPIISDPPPDVLPGISVDITCDPDTPPGPRNIIFEGNNLDPTHPSFGLRDQITGGLIVTE